jgi:pantothenate kinase-related protein Tda10
MKEGLHQNPPITISIGGSTASGKTTVAEIITRALAREGLEVKLTDDSLDPFKDLSERSVALRGKAPKINVRTESVMEGRNLDSPTRENAVNTYVVPSGS